MTSPRWSVAILSAREDLETLRSTVDAALLAASGRYTVIDILVNGNALVARALAAACADMRVPDSVSVRVWDIALRDKANAWNTYLHRVWDGGTCAFFVDGYAHVRPDAFERLFARLEASAHAVAAAAVPSVGRSASLVRAWMLAGSQIHGSLYAVRGEALDRMRRVGFRLPLGFYRSDALLGTLFNFNTDPGLHTWDDRGVSVVDDATWSARVASPWRLGDLRDYVARRLRQALGRLEEAAIKEYVYDRRLPVAEIPWKPLALLDAWRRVSPVSARRVLLGHPLAVLRLAQTRRRSDWPLSEAPPRQVFPA